ncbi:class I SAM-dependent methyltransferase [Oceaniglobus roseus]|uniref:class I SAM-dependent methyltransferase n=1 Tax=Oceaniglobus roseus TaxID=1737570 RepID=UPI000C7F7061|nr:class I SAM-dependent methyltransferase [Kandeliimicrobium roseum]
MTDFQSFNAAPDMDAAEIDRVNAAFYGRFNYPWPPMVMPALDDPAFMPRFTCQEVGDFSHGRVPQDATIWVAGCGTNQAVLTALRFPGARVIGTDISPRSLAVAQSSAEQIGLTNLTLEEASLNSPHHRGAFDMVICTGVIHHTADPQAALGALAGALKPRGVLELMVYNYYHRTQTTAYQKAIRLLTGATGRGGLLEAGLEMTAELIAADGLPGSMAPFLAAQRDLPEAAVADSLLQPVEYSYTVETLAALCKKAGLALLQPCINQFDRLSQRFSWDPPLPAGPVARAFDALDDVARWQVANLLMLETSPMLWFYAGSEAGPSRAEINADFLTRRFRRASAPLGRFQRNAEGRYERSDSRATLPQPGDPTDAAARAVHAACDGTRPMGEIVAQLGLATDPASLTRLRVLLTTPAFPYLLAT